MIDYTDKNILAIDSSSNRLILGLMYEGDKLVKKDELVDKSHGQMIINKIKDLLESAGLEISSIDAIVIQTGPGSFTGIRIGIATAKGIAVAFDLPIVSINLFELASFKLKHHDDSVHVVVPFKKDQYFITMIKDQKYEKEDILIIDNRQLLELIKNEPFAIYNVSLENDLTTISLVDYSEELIYDSSDLINLGLNKLNEGKFEDIINLEPLYLQKSQAEINFELRKNK